MKRILALALALVLVLGMGATAFAAEAGGKFVVSSAKAKPGEDVQLTISIQDNPGVASIELNVEFDTNALELTKVEKGAVVDVQGPLPEGAFGGFFDPVDAYLDPQPANKDLSTLTWFKDTASAEPSNNTLNGSFAVLTFKVNAGAEEGDYPVSVSFKDINVHDINENPVAFTVEAGKVTVTKRLPGDVNGDGKVDGRDVVRLKKYFAGDDVVIDFSNANVTGDGVVDGRDLIRLQKYFAGADVVLQ